MDPGDDFYFRWRNVTELELAYPRTKDRQRSETRSDGRMWMEEAEGNVAKVRTSLEMSAFSWQGALPPDLPSESKGNGCPAFF